MLITDDQTWTDDFEGPAGQLPDADVWGYKLGAGGWGCEQPQHYTSSTSNASLTGAGQLAITARREADGRITSARLVTTRQQEPCQQGTMLSMRGREYTATELARLGDIVGLAMSTEPVPIKATQAEPT